MPVPTYEGQNPSPKPEESEAGNPVIDALKTLQTFIQSEAEKNPASAEKLKSAFMALVAALKGGEAGSPVEQPAAAQPRPMNQGARPMNQGAGRTTPIM